MGSTVGPYDRQARDGDDALILDQHEKGPEAERFGAFFIGVGRDQFSIMAIFPIGGASTTLTALE